MDRLLTKSSCCKTNTTQRAIKRFKCAPGESIDFDTFVSFREIQVLKEIPIHANVIRIYDAILWTDGTCYLAFEYADQGSVKEYLDRIRPLASANKPLVPDAQIKSILRDALQGTEHIHRHGFFHRDIKPDNLLLCQNVCKIADFSLARPVATMARVAVGENNPPQLTTYIASRWYRAPELLLQSPVYGTPVDIYALGCVAAEMYDPFGRALFPCDSEPAQLACVFATLGTPTLESWPEGVRLMQQLGIEYPPMENCQSLALRLPPFLTETTRNFLSCLLALRPEHRLSASQALQHFYLQSGQPGVVTVSLVSSQSASSSSAAAAVPAAKTRKVIRNPYAKKT